MNEKEEERRIKRKMEMERGNWETGKGRKKQIENENGERGNGKSEHKKG